MGKEFIPTKKQADFFNDNSKVSIFQSGLGGGKSTWGLKRIKKLFELGKIKGANIFVGTENAKSGIQELIKTLDFPKELIINFILPEEPELLFYVDELPSTYNQITFTPYGSYNYVVNPTQNKKLLKWANEEYSVENDTFRNRVLGKFPKDINNEK